MSETIGVDKRKAVPPQIQQAAKRVMQIAIKEKTTSRILRSRSVLESIFFLRDLGERSESAVTRQVGINRQALRNNLERGREDIETNGKPKSASGWFAHYYDKFGTNPRFEALEKVKKDALAPDADPRVTMAYLKLICPKDFGYDPTGGKNGNVQITNNQLIVHQGQVNRILQLPPDQIEKFITNEAAALGIDMKRIEQQANGASEVNFSQADEREPVFVGRDNS